jgi:hypothetical protein
MTTVGSSNYSACFVLCGGQARPWAKPKSFACAINCGAQFIACWPCPSLSGQNGWDRRVAERAAEGGRVGVRRRWPRREGGGGTVDPPILLCETSPFPPARPFSSLPPPTLAPALSRQPGKTTAGWDRVITPSNHPPSPPASGRAIG